MTVSRLSNRLTSKSDAKYGIADPDWYQFICDHKRYIRSKSKRTSLAPLDLAPYRYRPDEFYATHRGSPNRTWILLLVNDLRDATDFTEAISDLVIPDPDLIRELRRSYESSVQYQRR